MTSTRRGRQLLPLALAVPVLALPASVTAGAAPAFVATPSPTVFVSEVHYDNTGTDIGEAIEISGPAGTNVTGWSVVLYNGSGGATYDTDVLTGTIPDLGGGRGAFTVSYPSNGIQNGSPDGIALVDPSSSVVQFLSYEGTFAATNGPAIGLTSTDIGVSEAGTEAAGLSLQLTLNAGADGGQYEDYTWNAPAPSTFAPPLAVPPPACPAAPTVSRIHQVQGAGASSPCVGLDVVVEGVVVGDYELPGGSGQLRGFYVQEEDTDADTDAATSEAVFVFTGGTNRVDLGQQVRVTGRVAEFEGQTQLGNATVTVLGAGAPVTPAAVTLPVPSATYLERFEGMSVRLAQTVYVTEHFQLGRFGQVVVSSGDRLRQPTAVTTPGAAANALQTQNDLNKLIVDDAVNVQNPDPIVFGRGGQPLSASNTLRGGDTLTDAVGVLTFTWAGNSASGNAYRLRPASSADESLASFVFEAANPRPEAAPAVGGDLTVASFNVLNYFLTLDLLDDDRSTPEVNEAAVCGVPANRQECRGAQSEEEFERQREKLLEALVRLDADVLGLIELENSILADGTEPDPLADIVAGLNSRTEPGTYASIDTGVFGTDTIRVGIVYRPSAVTPLGDHAIIDSTVDPRWQDDLNRPSLAQSFVEVETGEVLTVTVNHLKSKGCDPDSDPADFDQGDGQGCFNLARTLAADALVDWLASDPTGVGDADHLIIGDLNSYAQEDPITVLADAGYVDLAQAFAGEAEPYSYVFNGQWGYLDYALASPSLVAQVTGAAEDHINADEPPVLDYNTNFKTPGQVTSLYAPDEFRTSDHDPVLVGLDLDTVDPVVAASPASLWPPNHKLRTVDIGASAGGVPLDVEVLGVTSSEADAGLGEDDVPGDIVVVDDDTLRLRAERFSTQGRTYTATLLVSGAGQARVVDVDVVVPPNRGR